MSKKVVVSHKVLALLDEDEVREISTLDGEMYDTADRHYLHRVLGKLGDNLIRFVTKRGVTNKEVQTLVSARRCEPLVAMGLLEYVPSACQTLDVHFVVDGEGTLVGIEMKNKYGIWRPHNDLINRTMNAQDFLYRCIGRYYQK